MGQAMLHTSIDSLELAAAVGPPLRSLGIRMALLFPMLAVACGVFAIWLTHRFVGPQVAIQRQIDHLKTGDYTHTCTLRDGDELKPIAQALNELTEALRQEDRRQGIAA
jgi:signal transduction histidine kinase